MHLSADVQRGLPAWDNLVNSPVPTRDDLRDLAVLTALGVVLGLVHLAVRPGLPLVAQPPAMCELSEEPGISLPPEEPVMSIAEDVP